MDTRVRRAARAIGAAALVTTILAGTALGGGGIGWSAWNTNAPSGGFNPPLGCGSSNVDNWKCERSEADPQFGLCVTSTQFQCSQDCQMGQDAQGNTIVTAVRCIGTNPSSGW